MTHVQTSSGSITTSPVDRTRYSPGHGAWTGIEKDWLGVESGDMWWRHADTGTHLRWLSDAGLTIERETFVPEGNGGPTFIVAIR